MKGRPEIWALLAVQVLFGANSVAGRFALEYVGPQGLLVMRVVGATLVFWLVRIVQSEAPVPFSRADWWIMMACSLLGVTVNQGLFLWGLSLSTAVNVTLIGTSIPVFTVAMAAAAGHERLSAARLLGIALALAGVLYLSGIDHRGLDRASIGDLLILANALCYAGYLVLMRRLMLRHPPMQVIRWVFTLGVVTALPFLLVPGLVRQMPMPPAIYLVFVFMVLGPTVMAYFLNNWALQRVESSTVATFIYLQPLVATALAVPLLGERPTARTAVGALLVFSGVLVATWRRPSPAGSRAAIAADGVSP
jgi:drug/metabolite transporter (DMT)-like permease